MRIRYQEEYIAYAIIFGLLIAFSVFILKQYFYTSEKALDVINSAILFWTGIVIAIYTRETYKLREATQKQTELQQRPFVIFEIDTFTNHLGAERYYCVRNIGISPAINVYVRDVYPENADWYCQLRPDRRPSNLVIPLLMPRECSLLHASRIYKESRGSAWHDTGEILKGMTFCVRIDFANIDMTHYYVSQRMVKGHLITVNGGPLSGRT
jgi:hypothetical protein